MSSELVYRPLLPEAALAAAAALLGLLTLAAAWRTRKSWPLWANLCAIGVRAIALACAALLVLRPETLTRASREIRKPLVVLADATQSLDRRDFDEGPSRAEQGAPILKALLETARARGWDLLPYDAGKALEPRHPDDAAFHPRDGVSPLGEALAEALPRALEEHGLEGAPRPPGAGVVFSDGVVNAGQPLAEAAAAWGARGVPLFFVALGEDRPQPPDAALEQPTARPESEAPSGADGAPRAGDPIVVEARAQLLPGSKGLDGPLADTDARLWVLGPLGDPRATAYVEADRLRHRLRASPAWTAIRLRFTPKRAGFYRLRVTLDALPGERRLANNVAYAGVEIDPPRRRVVFAASRLGHDYRALKELFSRWSGPHVEIVADFVRAPTGSETQGWPVEAALRRWLDESVPASARAGTLVWAEPDPAHLPEALQARLRMALQQGELGLVWIVNEPAGALERRLRGSPLADTFLYKGLGAEEAPGTPQAVAGAEAARAHEATAWAYDGTGGEPWTAWGASRAWGGFALPRDGTQVLLHAGATPLLSTGKVGEGRVALLACGESWRWLTPAPQDPLRAQGLERAEAFWRRLADWAAGDPGRLDAPVRLYLARTRWERGETPQARVAVRMPAGLERCRVEAAVARLTGGGAAPVALEWRPLGRLEAAPGEPPGRERVVAGPVGAPLEQAGEYLIAARALRDDAPFGEDRAHLVAEGSPLEDRSVRPDLEGLQAAARAAGGASRVLQPDQEDLLALLDELDMRLLAPETVWREERRPAVPRTAILILLLAALAVDAWLRRG